jgi:hypothetical protein
MSDVVLSDLARRLVPDELWELAAPLIPRFPGCALIVQVQAEAAEGRRVRQRRSGRPRIR